MLELGEDLPGLLRARSEVSPDVPMLVDEDGRRLSFREVADVAESLAGELRALGVRSDTRVGWQLPTCLESVVLMFALSLTDAVQVPIPHMYRSHEVRSAVAQTAVDLLIVPGAGEGFDYAAMAGDALAELPVGLHTLERGALRDSAWLTPVIRASDRWPGPTRPPLADDVRWVFFTSGTSSAPKGVQHTDLSVGTSGRALAHGLQLEASDKSAIAFPIAHVGGLGWVTAALLSGCQLLLARRFNAETIDYLDREGVTLPGVVTAQHLAYRDAARNRPDPPLFRHARAYPGGGATKPPTLQEELRSVIGGAGIVSGYGMTEHPMITMASVDDPPEKLASTEGRPSPGVTVSVRDLETGRPLPAGQDGEIHARGPHMFHGYLDAAATAEVLDADGFIHTGDVGHLDPEGFVVITGRVKDVIVRKGENISAKEVEDHLYTHDLIADVAVVGLPDETSGERCCAVVVLRPSAEPPSVAAVGRYLSDRGLMPQKWPEQIQIVDELPRSTLGKVQKTMLVERFSARP